MKLMRWLVICVGMWVSTSLSLLTPTLYAQSAKTSAASTAEGAAKTGEAQAPAAPAAEASSEPVDPIAQCVANHTQGQVLRKSDKLLESRELFRQCTLTSCPEFIRRDCLSWSDEMRTEIPTVSLRATADGRVRTDAKVTVDGKEIVGALDGRSMEIDPGIHQVHLELDGYRPVDQEIVLSVGERFRVITAEFQPLIATTTDATKPESSAPTPPPPVPEVERPVPMLTYVFLASGGVAAISAVAFGISTLNAENTLEKVCAPNCSDHKIEIARQRALLTDISGGISIASFVTAGALYLFRPEQPVDQPVTFDAATLGTDGLFASMRVRFQ